VREGTPPSYDYFISYVDADEAWVDGYLLDALRKCGKCCHTKDDFTPGVPDSLNFERAIKQSAKTLLIISRDYQGDNVNRFIDLLAQHYGTKEGTWPVIPLLRESVELPLRLAMLTPLYVTDAEGRSASIKKLCDGIEPAPSAKPDCPYPGMQPFPLVETDDRQPMRPRWPFYGRDSEVQVLLQRLRKHPFIAITGFSGSGKSSLVFAGLVPKLPTTNLFSTGTWRVRPMRPKEAPLRNYLKLAKRW
jgi:hypothetical protein